jgi:DNA-binding beta-propeller fold protein YncE
VKRQRAAALAASLALVACKSTPSGTPIDLPNSSPGIGFDDLRFASGLRRVLAPGGRSGVLYLIDPDSRAVTTIGGFSTSSTYGGGHDFGATSVDEGNGHLFVTDRTTQKLHVVDPGKGAIVASVGLGGPPDYVRFIPGTGELWVTEPDALRIEIFTLGPDGTPTSAAAIPVDNGPESLVIDATHGRAYTHRWQSSTVVFDTKTRAMVAEWPNGCAASRGLAIDEAHSFFFVACSEGTVAVLDAAHDGHVLSSIAKGSGFDVIGYNPKLGHLYAAGSACGCLMVFGVNASGSLSALGRFDAPGSTHCVVADDVGGAWVCDPDGGRLLRVSDPYPASF